MTAAPSLEPQDPRRLLFDADYARRRARDLKEASDSPSMVAARDLEARAALEASLLLVDEQRTTNRLLVALLDQLAESARLQTGPGHPQDPGIRVRDYLPDVDWERLGL